MESSPWRKPIAKRGTRAGEVMVPRLKTSCQLSVVGSQFSGGKFEVRYWAATDTVAGNTSAVVWFMS
jgi:hypothetical protein